MVLFGTILFPAVGASAAPIVEKRLEPTSFSVGPALGFDGEISIDETLCLSVVYEFSVGSSLSSDCFFVGDPIMGNLDFPYCVVFSKGNFIGAYDFATCNTNAGSLISLLNFSLTMAPVELVIQFDMNSNVDEVGIFCTEEVDSLYYTAFDMFANFIYGEGVELTAEQNMVMTILATIAVLFVVVVPFLVVYFAIRLIFGR